MTPADTRQKYADRIREARRQGPDYDDICDAPSAGLSDEPSYMTPVGFPICSECGKPTRAKSQVICAPCRKGTRLLLTPEDRRWLRKVGIKR